MLLLLAALSVKVITNIPYLPNAQYPNDLDKLDLYLPEGRTGVPVIVWIHGGALTQDDKNLEGATGRRFASAGIATATVNYRLSPAVSHPSHVQDAAASFAWVKRHIAEYGGDPSQVFLVGHSAGAYLAELLVTDERYLKVHGLSARDVRGVVPISAFFWVEKEGVAPDRPKSVWGTDQKVWVDASPAHHVRANLPPTLIMYADQDEAWRRQQNVDMAQALKTAGSPPEDLVKIADRTHMGIWHRLGEEGDPASERVIAFVRAQAAQSTARDAAPSGFALWKASDLQRHDAALSTHVGDDHSSRETLQDYGDHRFRMLYRDADGNPEQHDAIIDVVLVQSGSGTLVLGGTMTGKRATGTGEWVGTRLDGGDRHPLGPGDIVHIPAGIPHSFLVPNGTHLTYVLLKIPAVSK